MSIIRCPHCGTTNRSGSNFCNRCGVDLREGSENPPLGDAPAAPDGRATAQPPFSPEPTPLADDQADLWVDDATSADGADGEWPDEADPPPGVERPRRLVSGVQGLLEPMRLTRGGDAEELASPAPLFTPLPATQADRLRRVRDLVAQDPVLADGLLPAQPALPLRLRVPWLIVLLVAAVALPLLLLFTAPVGTPQPWPGVAEAYATLDQVQPDAPIWILWAYDPATAGEMDLLALPMVSHLLERQGRPVLISLLPNGLATAQRLFTQALAELPAQSTPVGGLLGVDRYLEGGYLPGGAAALTLLAQFPATALIGHTDRTAFMLGPLVTQRPALAIVVAAQAEDVQQWLEQVQPLAPSPVVAFTSAAADPLLRPYLASGQLHGLVSGFDGAATYQQLRTRAVPGIWEGRWLQQLIAQNWGHAALLLILLLGNLRGLFLGRADE